MQPLRPLVERGGKLARLVAGHRVVPRVEVHLVRDQVPVPQAVVGRRHCQLVALTAYAQLLLRSLPVGDVGDDGAEPGDGSILSVHRKFAREEEMSAVGTVEKFLELDKLSSAEHFGVVAAEVFGCFRGEELGVRPSQHVGPGQTGALLPSAVHECIHSVDALDDHQRAAVLYQISEETFRFEQLAFSIEKAFPQLSQFLHSLSPIRTRFLAAEL